MTVGGRKVHPAASATTRHLLEAKYKVFLEATEMQRRDGGGFSEYYSYLKNYANSSTAVSIDKGERISSFTITFVWVNLRPSIDFTVCGFCHISQRGREPG